MVPIGEFLQPIVFLHPGNHFHEVSSLVSTRQVQGVNRCTLYSLKVVLVPDLPGLFLAVKANPVGLGHPFDQLSHVTIADLFLESVTVIVTVFDNVMQVTGRDDFVAAAGV